MSSDPPTLSNSELISLMNGLYGTQLAGSWLGAVLYGLVCMQAFTYYRSDEFRSGKDARWIRVLPIMFCILAGAHEGSLCSGMYKSLILKFGEETVVTSLNVDVLISLPFLGAVAMLAHIFYSYRIYRFGGKQTIIICVIAIPLTTLQLSLIIYYVVACAMHSDSLAFGASKINISYTVFGVNIGLDIMFTISMITLLHKEKVFYSRTQDMVHRLSLLVINTGLATTSMYILAIILSASLPGAVLGYTVPFYTLTPLYCISILANLNSRGYIRGAGRNTANESDPVGLSILQFTPNRFSNALSSRDVRGMKDPDINIGEATRMSEDV